MKYDVAIIGSGPAGLAAGYAAGMAGKKVLLLEKMDSPGLKLLASGGGRCNVSNILETEEFAARFGKNWRFLLPAFQKFHGNTLLEFFHAHQVPLTLPDGFHYFPESGRARDVLQLFLDGISRCGGRVICSEKVREIRRDRHWQLLTGKGEYRASTVIIAAGGRGYPALGGSMAGYELARQCGHTVTELFPAMTAVVIVGESGSGKSTIAKTLIGLEKPFSGTIVCNAKSVQMVFQDAVGSLNPRMTVRQTLDEVFKVKKASKRSVKELLDIVGLSQAVLEQYPREMSGGQCQRVSIARALACEPDVLIADEPVSALDVSVQARILNLLRDLRHELDLSILLIAHDLAVVKNVCDRVCVMQRGLFVDAGSAAEVFENPQSDYTKHLLAAVPDVARALAQRLTKEKEREMQ